MNKTESESFYKSLIPALWEDLLFYIPNNKVASEFIDNYKELDFQKFRNKVLVVDYLKGPVIYKSNRDNNKAILKGASLKRNIFLLLSKKSESNILEFSYILENYFEQTECLLYIAKWMNDNLIQILPIDDNTKGLFLLQFNNFNTHFKTLLKHFYPEKENIPKSNFNVINIIESSFPNLSISHHTKETVIPGTLDGINESVEKIEDQNFESPAIKKAKKTPIISENEAEVLLLKRIFNINSNEQ
ncbi:hypothetical protein D9O36_01845 [Zobellia amurskyensis]|uniref:Uncharacterized protein n=1 Tax=Zobellia amurskyensis TaxID=248905 RepID=A0A7X2ZQK1_9FLAO|nr:hypothetical protein [Zobellia amurskyensis]MUH34571.1 hypothetical protein [Zobellia amurskyensis]